MPSFSAPTSRRPPTCRRCRVCRERRWRNGMGGVPPSVLASPSSARSSSAVADERGLLQLSRRAASGVDLGGSHVLLARRDGGGCVCHCLAGTELWFSGRPARRRRWLLCRGRRTGAVRPAPDPRPRPARPFSSHAPHIQAAFADESRRVDLDGLYTRRLCPSRVSCRRHGSPPRSGRRTGATRADKARGAHRRCFGPDPRRLFWRAPRGDQCPAVGEEQVARRSVHGLRARQWLGRRPAPGPAPRRTPCALATHRLGTLESVAALGETAMLTGYLVQSGKTARPLTAGRYAAPFWLGAVGAGTLLPLLLHRLAGRRRGCTLRTLSTAAAVCTMAGSLALRWTIFEAGKDSSEDQAASFELAKD